MEFTEGFHGVVLSPTERSQLVAIAAAIYGAKHEYDTVRKGTSINIDYDNDFDYDEFDGITYKEDMIITLPPNLAAGHTESINYAVSFESGSELVVNMTEIDKNGEIDLSKTSKVVLADLDWSKGKSLATVTFDHSSGDATSMDEEVDESGLSTAVVQYLGKAQTAVAEGGFILRYLGCEQEIIVRTPREFELSKHMLPPVVLDHSKSLISPMPGTLISLQVKEGVEVAVGQPLAIVEAMKMQNVLHADKVGVVKKINKEAG
eukprot:CAMPEP_0117604806 /NCGR_PEP_ID=MMETSP0784-20121206/78873_1 /TAXON_ID=39447 /ORGANISM="" /LENGTH=261 /DNA_ID=CAMNT_0005407841 /DNA_START=150 /DNA_END=931 /DNA_ORIENTATION=+